MQTSASGLVAALVGQRPVYMSAFERIVGSVAMSFRREDHDNMGFVTRGDNVNPVVEQLSLSYAWDMYHQDPTRPRDVRLVKYELTIRTERSDVERILQQAIGMPRFVVDSLVIRGTTHTSEYAVYHPFYVRSNYAGMPMLSWHAEVPRFAMHVPEPDRRRAWLADLRQCCDGASSIDEIDALCRAAPIDAGIEITGTLNNSFNSYASFKSPTGDARDYHITFAPPVNALLLAEVFGWTSPVGSSHDVHMSSWQIERRGDHWAPISGTHQHWEVHAHLEHGPSGAAEPDSHGPSSSCGLGDADEVGGLSIRPRFR